MQTNILSEAFVKVQELRKIIEHIMMILCMKEILGHNN